ncbi:hypothetical protein [Parabacteroides sp. Marseille-P3160]|uniref:hypothetical protein n=1 Tax=Parabacteroides sp. Marseille-P3160 TaxID=1917887 RepID=UPI0009B9F5B2|nr:hypothetical protein [Parabacteroides sp. Marseille-P3160]
MGYTSNERGDILGSVKSSLDAFYSHQEELHKTMCSPDLSNIQELIESNKDEKIRELEILLHKSERRELTRTIIGAIVGSVATIIVQSIVNSLL